MRKLLAALLLLILVLSGAYCAASYWVGAQAQKQYEILLAQVSRPNSVEIATTKYDRGIFLSTAQTSVTVTLQGKEEPLNFTLVNTIQHGPLAMLSNPHATRRFQPVQAVITTRLAPAAENGNMVRKALEEVPELASSEIWTVLYLDGSGESYADVPAFQKKFKDAQGVETSLDWGGFHSRSHFDIALNEGTGTFNAPWIKLNEKGEWLNVRETRGEFSARADRNDVTVGDMSIACKGVDFTSGDGNVPFRLEGPGIETGSGGTGDTVNGFVRFHFDKLAAAGGTYGPFSMELEARKLDAAALSRFQKNLKEIGASEKSGRDVTKALNSCYMQLLTGLAAKSPEIELKELRLGSDKGDFTATAKIVVAGSGFSLDNPILLLLSGISANADVFVAEPLLSFAVEKSLTGALKVEGGPSDEEAASLAKQRTAKTIEQLLAQNYLVRDGASLKVSAAYKAGRITVNGRKIPVTDLLKGGPALN